MKRLLTIFCIGIVSRAWAQTSINGSRIVSGYENILGSETVQGTGGLGVTYGVVVGSLTCTGSPCGSGGGGGGASGQINASPQFQIGQFSVAGTSNVITGISSQTWVYNASSLQSGATFYVSSGTVAGNLSVSTLTVTGTIGVGTPPIATQGIKSLMSATSGSNFAIDGTASGAGATTNYGLYGWASGATNNYALYLDSGVARLANLNSTLLAVDATGIIIATTVVSGGGGSTNGTITSSTNTNIAVYSNTTTVNGSGIANLYPSSMTLNGTFALLGTSSAAAQSWTEGSATTTFAPAAGKDNFWADSSSHAISGTFNGSASTYSFITSSVTPVSGQFPIWLASGPNAWVVGSSVPAGSGGSGGTNLLPTTNTWTGGNTWTSPQISSFTFGVYASTLTLQTVAGGSGGNLIINNSGNNSQAINFNSDAGASDATFLNLHGSYFRMDFDEGAFHIMTGDTDRFWIDGTTGNIGMGTGFTPTNSAVGIIGTSPNKYVQGDSTSTTGPYIVDVSTTGHINSQAVTGATVTSCGTTPAFTGSDIAGTITTGSGSPTACTLTFAKPFTNTPVCVVSDTLDTAVAQITSISNTNVVFGFSAGLNSGKILYICIGSD